MRLVGGVEADKDLDALHREETQEQERARLVVVRPARRGLLLLVVVRLARRW
jgi:hypothetical protein